MRHDETGAARALAAPLIVDAIKARLIKLHRPLSLGSTRADALVIDEEGSECERRHAQPRQSPP